MFYKLIDGQNIVGAAESADLRKYQPKHNLVLVAEVQDAQFIDRDGKFYHDDWMQPVSKNDITYERISILRIEESEYRALVEAFETASELSVEAETQEPPLDSHDDIQTDADSTISFVKHAKITQMSKMCQNTIESGFDVILSDGGKHHFRLTTNDQINMMAISAQIASGVEYVPYHADGELCVFYSAQDATSILNAATSFKSYHTTYFNSLKHYIDSLQDINDISNVQYGDTIPCEYRSPVYNVLVGEANEESI